MGSAAGQKLCPAGSAARFDLPPQDVAIDGSQEPIGGSLASNLPVFDGAEEEAPDLRQTSAGGQELSPTVHFSGTAQSAEQSPIEELNLLVAMFLAADYSRGNFLARMSPVQKRRPASQSGRFRLPLENLLVKPRDIPFVRSVQEHARLQLLQGQRSLSGCPRTTGPIFLPPALDG